MELVEEQIEEGLKCLHLSGRLGAKGGQSIEMRFSALTATNSGKYIVDMSAVDFVASIGMRLLLSNAKANATRGGRMALSGLQPMVKETFETAGIDNLIPIYPDQASALAGLRGWGQTVAAMNAGHTVHRLSIAGRHEELVTLAGWLEEIAAACELPAAVAYHLDLVLTEAVTNVMDYACEPGTSQMIELACGCCGDGIHLEVADTGPAFDPTLRAQPSLPRSLEEATPGGLGILLMRKYTSSMHYRREDGCNILSMVVPNPAPASMEARLPAHDTH